MNLVKQTAQSLDSRLIAMRRELHQHPELSGEEVWTTERLKGWLAEAGIPVLPLDLKTGVVAEIRGAKPGPVVALRGDIDALPVQEQTGLDYASTIPGHMHACGHDFHTTVLMGSALILQQMRQDLAGTVRLLFQPAEEHATGARDVIAAGALEGVKAIIGGHNKPDVPSGHVGIKAGPIMAASDSMAITITGKGGHAAIPNATIDPVVAASAVVMALQTAVSRVISPLDSAVVSIGHFQAGTAHNVIPSDARLEGTVRTFTKEVRTQVHETIARVVRDVAAGYGCTGEVEWLNSIPAVDNDAAIADLVTKAAEAVEVPVVHAVPTMGAEDFSEYQQLVPGCFIWIGTGCQENWHHPKFVVDESALKVGAAVYAQAAIEALKALA